MKLTDDEERATGARLEHAAERAPRHSVQRLDTPIKALVGFHRR